MTLERCENCGTEVAAMTVVENHDPATGWKVCTLPDGLPEAHVHTVLDAVEGVGLYEYTRSEDQPPSRVMPPTVALCWFEHTAERCRRVRERASA